MIFKHMSNRDNLKCVIGPLRSMFINYNLTVEKAGSCATDDMKAFPEQAIAEALSCLPTPDDWEKKKEQAKEKFDELLEKLKEADEEITATTDELQKLVKVGEVEWTVVYDFFKDVSDKAFNDVSTIHELSLIHI